MLEALQTIGIVALVLAVVLVVPALLVYGGLALYEARKPNGHPEDLPFFFIPL